MGPGWVLIRPARILLASAAVFVLASALAEGASGYAFDRSIRVTTSTWPFPRITYFVAVPGPGLTVRPAPARIAGPVNGAFRAWNAARVGWDFARVRSSDRSTADVIVLVNLTRSETTCLGRSTRAFHFSQHIVGIRGPCIRNGVLGQIVSHEIGHVLGLGDERRACAVMNPGFLGSGPRARPSRCRAGPNYERRPIQADDRRGARALRLVPFRQAGYLCDPPPPDQPVNADDPDCKYSYDCRHASGDNHDTQRDSVDDEIHRRCRRTLVVSLVPAVHHLGRGVAAAHGSYDGVTSQGKRVAFSVRRGLVRGLSFGIHLVCDDNNQAPNGSRPGRPGGDEVIGPFPVFGTGRKGFMVVFEPGNSSTVYELSGTFYQGVWRGTIDVIEAYHDTPDWVQNGELQGFPDPDGEWVCDSGPVTFSAAPTP
jgi:hypothetical protein